MKWNVYTSYQYLTIGKVTLGKYEFDDVLELSKEYKYIYKATQNFSRCEFDGKYSLYILSQDDLGYLIVFLNDLNVFKIITNTIGNIKNYKTLYNIKEKIEVI